MLPFPYIAKSTGDFTRSNLSVYATVANIFHWSAWIYKGIRCHGSRAHMVATFAHFKHVPGSAKLTKTYPRKESPLEKIPFLTNAFLMPKKKSSPFMLMELSLER